MKKAVNVFYTLLVITVLACGRNVESKTIVIVPPSDQLSAESSLQDSYMPFLKELAQMECSRIRIRDFKGEISVYEVHTAAFQEILKDPDRDVLARYEELFQALARFEYLMSEKDRQMYDADTRKAYAEACR